MERNSISTSSVANLAAPDDVRYKFKFIDPKTAAFPHIRFKDIVFSDDKSRVITERIAAQGGLALSTAEKDRIKDHVDLVRETFFNESGIGYQQLDSIDQPDLYREDDVVEIFIRANSGGTRLGKSDLLFSLLTSAWEEADDKMEILLDELNMQGFAFTRDFILKTCLTLLGQGARYEVAKFRKAGVRDSIEKEAENDLTPERWDRANFRWQPRSTFALHDPTDCTGHSPFGFKPCRPTERLGPTSRLPCARSRSSMALARGR